MLNDGCDVWPNGTMLQPVSSNDIDMLRATNQTLPATKPGSFVTVSTMITIPKQPGHYRTEFKLRTPNGQLFGDDIWVDIISVPDNSSNNNSMVYPTISTSSSYSDIHRTPSADTTSVIRHDELLDPSDENEDDDDPFMDPSITSYTPSRRLSSSSLETSSEEEDEMHGNNDEQHASPEHQSSRASSEEFVVVDNNDQYHAQNPHEKTPPKVITPTASFHQQSSTSTTQTHTSPTSTPNTHRNPVPGLFDQQMRQIHEMVSRSIIHEKKYSLTPFDRALLSVMSLLFDC